jgi:hypothetical protein
VTAYTITITPDDDSATTTRLRLDTSGDQVVLTDLHLHASDGLSTGQLPAIDYGLLLRAIATSTPTPLSVQAGAPAAAAQPATGGRARRAGAARKAAPAAKKSARAAKRTAKATAARTTGGTGRAYRRMPEDFAAVYQRAGSAAAVAEHYRVPRHTANGWIRRLRDQGAIPASR